MSKIIVKSPKHCAKQTLDVEKHYKKLIYIFSTFFLTILSFIFLIWFILHPSNPEFSLKQADIYQLNLSTTQPHLLTCSMQVTLLSKNSNKRLGLYYDNLEAFVTYKDEQISNNAPIPPFYQAHEDGKLLTCSLTGTGLPITPSFSYELSHDQVLGRLLLSVKVNGRLRWKVGSWVSHWHRFDVDCVTTMEIGMMNGGWSPLSSKGSLCATNV